MRQLPVPDQDAEASGIEECLMHTGGDLGKRNRIREFLGPPAAEKAGDLELAWLTPQLVAFLDLAHQLEPLERRVEPVGQRADPAGGRRPEVEYLGAQRPAIHIPLARRAVAVASTVARIVEGAGVDERPAQEICLRIVGIFVGIEDVDDRELAEREHQPVRRLRAGEPVEIGVHVLGLAAPLQPALASLLTCGNVIRRGQWPRNSSKIAKATVNHLPMSS